MPDTRRSLSSLQTLYADNTSGAITAQVARDELISSHPEQAVQTGAYASIPAASQLAGDLYMPTDAVGLFRWSGSAWVPWGPVFPFSDPSLQTWAWVNQGTATVSTTGGGILLDSGTTASGLRIRKKAAPATPYTITCCFLPNMPGTVASAEVGLCFRESSSGKVAVFCPTITSNFHNLLTEKWTNPTTWSATYTNGHRDHCKYPTWLQIADDGTNRICRYSPDGRIFQDFHSVGRTDFLTADEVGFYVYPNSSTAVSMRLLSWKEA